MLIREGRMVCVWIGQIAEPDVLDAYLRDQFSRDFGVAWTDEAAPEATCQDSPVSVANILVKFSQGRRFAHAAGAAAVEAGQDSVHCAVVFHSARYDGA